MVTMATEVEINIWTIIILLLSGNDNRAGDVTRVSVMPRKVTVKIGDAEIKIVEKRQKFLSVYFYLEYPLSMQSEIRPIKYQNMSSL